MYQKQVQRLHSKLHGWDSSLALWKESLSLVGSENQSLLRRQLVNRNTKEKTENFFFFLMRRKGVSGNREADRKWADIIDTDDN